jgi:hypothetical protein
VSRKGTPSALSSGAVTAVSTAAINLASAGAAILLSHRFGRSARTDGFLIAYSVYLVITLAASAFRVVTLPALTRAREEGRFREELAAFAAALAVVAAPVLAVAVGVGLTLSGSTRVDAFAHGLPWFVGAGVLQLFGGLAASGLAAHDSYRVAAGAYAGGAVLGVALFAALSGHGIQALAWGQLLNGVVVLAVTLAALRVGRVAVDRRIGRRLAVLARGTAVPIALQLLYLIAVTLAGRLAGGEPTTFVYAYFFASFLVSVTASALSLVSSAPLTRRGLTSEAAAAHVVNATWLSLAAIAAAVGLFGLVGGRVVASVLGEAWSGQTGHELVRLVVFFAPWMVASAALTVAFPLLFVAERPRVLIPLAVVLPLVQVPLAWALEQAWGLRGLALALALTTFAALAVLMAGISRRTLALTAAGLGRVAVVIGAAAALSFGGLAALLGGVPAAVVGAPVYLVLLALALPLGLREAWGYVRAL